MINSHICSIVKNVKQSNKKKTRFDFECNEKKIVYSIVVNDRNAASNANNIVNRYNNSLKDLHDLNDSFFRNNSALIFSNLDINVNELYKTCENKIIY